MQSEPPAANEAAKLTLTTANDPQVCATCLHCVQRMLRKKYQGWKCQVHEWSLPVPGEMTCRDWQLEAYETYSRQEFQRRAGETLA